MTRSLHAVRLGLARGWIEFRNGFTTFQDVGLGLVLGPIFLVILILGIGEPLPGLPAGLPLDLASFALPGVLGVLIGVGGVMSAAYWLAAEREDGTLLRAKAVPHGMTGYLTARVLTVSADTVIGMLIVLVPGLFLFDGLAAAGLSGYLTLSWVVVLGLCATLPWGAILGAVLRTPRAVSSFGFIPLTVFTAISGIFAPLQVWPAWVQSVAQALPFYWLGVGMRSALLPGAAVVMEIDASWRILPTVGVLAGWAVVGLLLAPPILRRMARGESGARLEARRQRAIQRIG